MSAVCLPCVLASQDSEMASAARKHWPWEAAAFQLSEVIQRRPGKQQRGRTVGGSEVGLMSALSCAEMCVGLYLSTSNVQTLFSVEHEDPGFAL